MSMAILHRSCPLIWYIRRLGKQGSVNQRQQYIDVFIPFDM